MKKLLILGLDIGGANTKAALIFFENNMIKKTFSCIEYFPFWEHSLDKIPKIFEEIVDKLLVKNKFNKRDLDYIAISITAELSDAFKSKKEGIFTILDALERVFRNQKMVFISTNNTYISFNEAKNNYMSIVAANWVSTSLFLGHFISQCILIDAGSTTIDIIPISKSIPIPKGKDDVSRLIHHELIYTGGLRASIPSITHFVPFRGAMVRISFEKFALISDVHRILNNIAEQEYLNDTADNRSKSIEDCHARLARIICADIDTVSIEEIREIAKFIYNRQLKIISQEIKLFLENFTVSHPEFQNNPKFVITGLSAEFLIRPSLQNLGYHNIEIYEKLTKIPDNVSSSAFAVAGALNYQME